MKHTPGKEWQLPTDVPVHRVEFKDGTERVRCGAPLRSSVVVADDAAVTCPKCIQQRSLRENV